jgi:hypothetical protein
LDERKTLDDAITNEIAISNIDFMEAANCKEARLTGIQSVLSKR